MVTVVITTYKREPSMVARAIASVFNQTYHDIELIIVDDSPMDYPLRKAVEMAVRESGNKRKDISVRYIAHDGNRGACAARNTGMNHAKGDYVAYLDDDDEWLPEKLEKQLAVIQGKNIALVYCGRICENDTTGVSYIENTEYHRGNIFNSLLYQNYIGSTSFPLIKKQCLLDIGGFDEEMQSAQDFDVWLRIAKKYQIDYVPEPLVIYHEHVGEQITNNPMKKIAGLERINIKFGEEINADSNLWYRRNIVIAPYYSMIDDKRKALQIWFSCVYKCPWKINNNLRYLRAIIKNK